jgi:hypothetical protein
MKRRDLARNQRVSPSEESYHLCQSEAMSERFEVGRCLGDSVNVEDGQEGMILGLREEKMRWVVSENSGEKASDLKERRER